MEAEIVLNLLDSYWYDLDLFKRSKPTKNTKIQEQNSSSSALPNLPTIHTKSPILEKMSSKLSDSSASPDSVLFTSKLQTIFSGIESKSFEDSTSEKEAQEVQETTPKVTSSTPSKSNARRRKKRGLSKSLSDLEFEELKGFMDLGFVFSEEDKDSILASIIPGLQKLGASDKNDTNNVGQTYVEKYAMSRPYLSEAWDVLEKKKKENSLMNWKVPAHSSQVDMKDYIRNWAHTVASTVR